MGSLPAQVTTGRVYWRVESDYLPAGAVSPITVPARGTVRLEPHRGAMNLPTVPTTDPLGMTLGLRTRTFALGDGVLDRTIIADAFEEGWTYRVVPSLEVMDDTGKYVTAPPELNAPFNFHLKPGVTVDLADERPLGIAGTGGTLVSRGVGLTGTTRTVSGGVRWELTDGSWSDVVPMVTGTATQLQGNVTTQADLPAGLTDADAGKGWVTTDTYHLWQWSGTSWVDLGPTNTSSGGTGTPGTAGSSDTLTIADMTV